MYYAKPDSIRCFAALAVLFAHIFQIWTWDRDLFPLGNAGMLSDWSLPWWSKLLPVVVCLVLVVGVAELSYRLIERPLLRLKTCFRTPKPMAQAA